VTFELWGWNENTLACLLALRGRQLVPTRLVVASDFDCRALVAGACDVEIRSCGRGETVPEPAADLLVTASWPHRIHASTLAGYRHALNVHASLLPKYRGRHPLNWALIHDERELGVTVHLLDEGLDTGDILLRRAFSIDDNETITQLRARTHALGGELLAEVLADLPRHLAGRHPQDERLATHAPRRWPADGVIDWQRPVRAIFCLVRASAEPGPGAMTCGGTLTLWDARAGERLAPSAPGTVIAVSDRGFDVAACDGVLRVLRYDGPAPRVGDLLR
jgi:UDP-4-amino-4-deoxy-L-arabinose formyltransferase / UDP-glucuronic acid dehydrogenase (UDP-4-keto-hexauronic acid decarboxylating)